MPGFCSECGERLKTKRARLLFPRARCYQCDRGLRRSSSILLSGMLVLSLSAGFVVGRYTRKPEPFYIIGTPIQPRSSSPVSSADGGSQEDVHPEGQVERRSGAQVDSICGAPTRSGKPCQRRVRGGGFCWQHRKKSVSRSAFRVSRLGFVV